MKTKLLLTIAALALSACAQTPSPTDGGKDPYAAAVTPVPGTAITSNVSINYVVRAADQQSASIAPNRVWSDGRFTYMSFAGAKQVPVIFVANGQDDQVVNWRFMPGYAEPTAVIETVADAYHVRLGAALVEVKKAET
jgi:type IV secretory pathway VirB9-like protein